MFVNQGFTAHHIAEVYTSRGRKLPVSTIYTLIRRMRTERGQSTSATARRLAHETTDDHTATQPSNTLQHSRGVGGWTMTSVGMIYDNR